MKKPIPILLLEADADADASAEELRRGGLAHVARCVAGKESFLTALRDFKPEVIVADHDAAGCSGSEALRLARQVCPEVPIILMVSPPAEGLATDLIQRGAADCVFKRHRSQLTLAVARALRETDERKQRRRAETLLEIKYQQLQLQNDALQQSEERFRQLAETIREVFWMTDAGKTQFLYISPAYEAVWGRTCAALYESPREWSDAVHPEDRDRVQNLARHGPDAAEYDTEYRISRPDGAVRWIHDRAFPVRDETGAIYRVAGVAEDVTGRKHLERQILEIRDREQERIGRDLHDELCQQLVSIGFNANTLRLDLEKGSRPEASAAERIGRRLTTAIKLTRDLAHGLCPANFENEDLALALNQLARNTSEDFDLRCSADCPAGKLITDPNVAMHAFRIAREAVHNAVKHGQPKHIGIRLSAEAGRVLLTVTDDGRGISADPKPGPGLGLEIMKYRARMICGTLDIRPRDPAEGVGTILSCSFPQPAPTEPGQH